MTDNEKIVAWLIAVVLLSGLRACADKTEQNLQVSTPKIEAVDLEVTKEKIASISKVDLKVEQLAAQKRQLLKDYDVLQKRLESSQ